ncbi:MAG: hypothetical protein RDU14_00845 [Melioribacteraceae bacterium]|nr:hypothetical protein [Melioribacteraceae bacterium]
MKIKFTITVLLISFFWLLFNSYSFSQVKPDAFLNKVRVDFAVPDAPAFKVLQNDPSSVLRPASARDVAITIADLFQGGKIPENYALEISPGLIFGNSLTRYQANPFFYRARISLATKSLENSARQVGAGVRLTLWDETDLRMDKTLQAELINLGEQSVNLMAECGKELAENGIDLFQPDYDDLLNACLDKKDVYKKIYSMIETQREIAKKKKWNAPIVEVGLAMSALSGDSLAKNLAVDSYRWWLAGAFPLGSEGQIVAGLNGGITKNSNGELKNSESNFSLRGYYGDNQQKVFLEGGIRAASEFIPSISFNIGYEYNLLNGLWADISLGLIKKEGSKFVSNSSLNFRFATPE